MADELQPRLFGVLVTYRRSGELARTLRNLENQDVRLAGLAVVDNAAEPAVKEVVDGHPGAASWVSYVPMATNMGPAGGIATGMGVVLDQADARDWVVVFDDDDPPEPLIALRRTLALADRAASRFPKVGAVGLAGARLDERLGRLRRLEDVELTDLVAVDYIGGGQMLTVSVEAAARVGPFRSELFFGFDDLDFGLRLRAAGYNLVVDGDHWLANRDHQRLVRTKAILTPETLSWRQYYSVRNLIYILRKAGHLQAAVWVTLRSGVAKPLVGLLRRDPLSWPTLKLSLRACSDGWRDCMGRTVEPTAAMKVDEPTS